VAKGFDADTSDDPLVRGFTSCDPHDLPAWAPARSLSDNIHNEKEVDGALRTAMMDRYGDKAEESHVAAYPSVQFGNKVASMDADDDCMPKVGNYKKNGQ